MDGDEILKHESYGQIAFSRITGRAEFYGSELTQDHYIQMEVRNSEIHRGLTGDNYFNTGIPLIKVRLTSGQFAEMITSMNMGTGVPCTIERVKGIKVEELPQKENRKEFVHRMFDERMKQFADKIRDKKNKAKELVQKKTLSKQDIHELNLYLDYLTQEIESNIPFFAKCFQETTDKVVSEAKMEVENAIQHKVNVLGLKALAAQQTSVGFTWQPEHETIDQISKEQ